MGPGRHGDGAAARAADGGQSNEGPYAANSICICLFCLSEWDSGDRELLLRSRRPHHFLPATRIMSNYQSARPCPPPIRVLRFCSPGPRLRSNAASSLLDSECSRLITPTSRELLHGSRVCAAVPKAAG